MSDKTRIIDLQRQIKICREALTKISYGTRSPEAVAADALYRMFPLDPKQDLAGICGHDKRGSGTR